MIIQRSMTFRRTSNSEKFIGNGAAVRVRKEESAMPQASCANEASMKLQMSPLGGILSQMMHMDAAQEWMLCQMSSNFSKKYAERHRQLIKQLIHQWLLTSNLRTNLHRYSQEVRLILPE